MYLAHAAPPTNSNSGGVVQTSLFPHKKHSDQTATSTSPENNSLKFFVIRYKGPNVNLPAEAAKVAQSWSAPEKHLPFDQARLIIKVDLNLSLSTLHFNFWQPTEGEIRVYGKKEHIPPAYETALKYATRDSRPTHLDSLHGLTCAHLVIAAYQAAGIKPHITYNPNFWYSLKHPVTKHDSHPLSEIVFHNPNVTLEILGKEPDTCRSFFSSILPPAVLLPAKWTCAEALARSLDDDPGNWDKFLCSEVAPNDWRVEPLKNLAQNNVGLCYKNSQT